MQTGENRLSKPLPIPTTPPTTTTEDFAPNPNACIIYCICNLKASLVTFNLPINLN